MKLLKISRLEGLTDGIFAIAMTILVLDLRLPHPITATELPAIFEHVISLKIFIYAGSFIILGTLWIAMNFQLGLLKEVNRIYLWSNILYLMIICVIPFSANLVATFPYSALSIRFFGLNLFAAMGCQLIIFQCAHFFHLNGEIYNSAIRRAIIKRILLAPFFYFSAFLLAPWQPLFAFALLVAPILIYVVPGQIDRYNDPSKSP